MYCSHCGIRNDSTNQTCTHCGQSLMHPMESEYGRREVLDTPNTWANIFACLFPLAGIIFYFVWRDEMPTRARSVCTWTLFGVFGIPLLWFMAVVLGALSFGFSG